MRRRRYQTHADVNEEARRRAAAGMHPAVVAASQAAQAAQTGGAAAPPEPPAIQRISGELPAQQANRPQPPAPEPRPNRPYYGRLDPTKLAGSMGGTAADLGIAQNSQQGNPRSGQKYRRFIGGDGFEHHVYTDGTDIRVKPTGTDQENLVNLRLAAAARNMDGTGQPGQPGPQDATGQQDLSAVHALPVEQQMALMQLASAAAAQATENAQNPALSIMPRDLPRRRRR